MYTEYWPYLAGFYAIVTAVAFFALIRKDRRTYPDYPLIVSTTFMYFIVSLLWPLWIAGYAISGFQFSKKEQR